LYHRERIWFSSTLSCNEKEEEKITKPLILGLSAHFNQPGKLWARQPISINQATLGSSALFNQSGNFGLISPFQSTRQLWAHQPFSINQATLDNAWPGTVSSTCLNS
jgi:hypothetical protein